MKYTVHAGHNPKGKIGCGASHFIDESTENRKVSKEVIKKLKLRGHTVYDCTVNNGTSQNNILFNIVKKCNKYNTDYDVSIHFNSFKEDKGNGKVKGVEILVYDLKDYKQIEVCNKILEGFENLGFTNRGIKVRPDLYFLRETKDKAILIEVCFVDDKDDVNLYKKVGIEKIANAIANGLELHKKVKSNKDIAKEVINGYWGTGATRKRKLTKAGYDYAVIQKLVNDMLKGK